MRGVHAAMVLPKVIQSEPIELIMLCKRERNSNPCTMKNSVSMRRLRCEVALVESTQFMYCEEFAIVPAEPPLEEIAKERRRGVVVLISVSR